MEILHNRKMLFKNEIDIPGLVLFGYNKSTKASGPLLSHFHKDCIEIVVLINGSEAYIASDECYTVTGSEAFMAHLNEYHRSFGNFQGINEFIWFHLEMTSKQNFLGLGKKYSLELYNKLVSHKEHILKADNKCISLLKEAFNAVESENSFYAQGLFTSFLYRLLFMQKIKCNHDILINKALDYINANILNKITIEEICLHCNISLSTLKHNFKKTIRNTPRGYINEMKIEKAKELLKSDMTVTDTAFALSFNSSDYFSVVFKKYTFLTPEQYKKQK